MRQRRLLALALCAAAVAVAGCPEPGYYIDVSFDGNMTASADGFEMDGAIVVGGGAAKLDAYRSVTVSLYAENGTLLYSETAGTLEGLLPYSLTVPFVPHYVVIDSPDFWREPRVAVSYYVRVEGRDYDYDQEPARSRDELPPDGEESGPSRLPAGPAPSHSRGDGSAHPEPKRFMIEPNHLPT